MPPPSPPSAPPPAAHDPNLERLRELQTWQLAYCRDVVKPLTPEIRGVGLATGMTMVGRAYTVEGPDVYLDALEGIGPGEVFVHAGCSDIDSVFSPGWSHAYLKPRGAVGAIVDGGVYKSFECSKAAVPIFAKFASPSVAINRPHAHAIGQPVRIGRATIRAGDIVCGDADGVVVIPQQHEADLMRLLEGYLEGNGAFGRLAAKHVIGKGELMTTHEATADMFKRKYANPDSYWRHYAAWWAAWKEKYADVAGDAATGVGAAFYSGRAPPKSKL